MPYTLVAFRSRSDAVAVRNRLIGMGYDATVVQTPRQISRSCGLSVKTVAPAQQLRAMLAPMMSQIIGFYRVRSAAGSISYIPE